MSEKRGRGGFGKIGQNWNVEEGEGRVLRKSDVEFFISYFFVKTRAEMDNLESLKRLKP